MARASSGSRKGFSSHPASGLSALIFLTLPLVNRCETNPVRSILSTAETPLPSPNHASTIIRSGLYCNGGHRIGLGGLDCANIVAHRFEHLGKQHADHEVILHHEDAERLLLLAAREALPSFLQSMMRSCGTDTVQAKHRNTRTL